MEKPKRKPKTSDYDFSFVAPLSLEECIYRIESGFVWPHQYIFWTVNYAIRGNVTPINEHQARFQFKYGRVRRLIPEPDVLVGYLESQNNHETLVYGHINPNRGLHFCLIPHFIIGAILLIATIGSLSEGVSIATIILLVYGLLFISSPIVWPRQYQRYALYLISKLEENLTNP